MNKFKKAVLVLALANTCVFADESIEFDSEDFGVVLSATRLKTAKKDVPGSVTKITKNQIESLNIRSIPEALRLAPGMNAFNFDGNQAYVSYRGTNYPEPRRMSIYIDGVPFVRSGFTQIDWLRLPINIEDVSSIEVYRGPNTAAYGADAFLGVVNIITLHPKETQGWMATATYGSINTKEVLLRYSGKITENDAFKISFSTRENTGFDKKEDGQDRLDSTDSKLLNYYYTHDINDRSRLDFQGGLIDGDNGREPIFSESQLFPSRNEEKKTYNRLRWTNGYGDNNELMAQMYHRTNKIKEKINICFPALLFTEEMHNLFNSNQNYVNTFLSGQAPSGGSQADNMLLGALMGRVGALGGMPDAMQPVCGVTNQDVSERETSFALENTTVLSDDMRIVLGGSYRDAYVRSETFAGEKPTSRKSYDFHGHLEYGISENNILHLGGNYGKNNGETSFSPRLGFNHHFDEFNTFRFVYSQATRFPAIFEQEADWSYKVQSLSPVLDGLGEEGVLFISYKADGTLKEEEIESWELGYHFENAGDSVYVDVKLFKDNLDDLISEIVTIPNWNTTNDGESTLKGLEIEGRYILNDNINFYTTYAYLDVDTNTNFEKEYNPQNTFSFYAAYINDNAWSGSLGLFYANKLRKNIYSRIEGSIGKSFDFGGSDLSLKLGIKHRVDSGREVLIDNLYDDDTHYFLTMTYTTE